MIKLILFIFSEKNETKDSNNFDVGDYLDDLDNFTPFLSN